MYISLLLLFLQYVEPFPFLDVLEPTEGPNELWDPVINDRVTEKTRFKDYHDFITGPTPGFPDDEIIDNIVAGPRQGSDNCQRVEQRMQHTDPDVAGEIRSRVSQLTSRYQRLRSHKPLVRHQLHSPSSILRRFLGNIGQDPADTGFVEGFPDTHRKIPLNFIQALNNVAGQTGTVLGYLLAFGYLQEVMELPDSVNEALDEGGVVAEEVEVSPCQLQLGIKEFQRFNGLEATGELDKATVKKLKSPRCGMKDLDGGRRRNKGKGRPGSGKFGGPRPRPRPRRYVLRQRSWKTKTRKGVPLTYKILNCTTSLPHEECKKELSTGFMRWTEVTPIKFRELELNSSEEADFTIFFVSGEHPKKDRTSGRNDVPFDGPGGVIGHAYFPRGGVIHFDNDEAFTAHKNSGINLRFVAMHEMGHALGLEHSRVRGAVMAPSYDTYVDDYNMLWIGSDVLHQDDVAGIRTRYGEGKGNVKTLKGYL